MRDIKFRAWNYQEERFIGHKDLFGTGAYFNDPFSRMDIDLQQYTGLKDKNGKEIYEGDILSVIPRGEFIEWFVNIIWDDVEAQFRTTHYEKGNTKIYDVGYFDQLEVIGNIYENSELINQPEL